MLVVRVFVLAKMIPGKWSLGGVVGKMHSLRVEMLEYHELNQNPYSTASYLIALIVTVAFLRCQVPEKGSLGPVVRTRRNYIMDVNIA